METPRHVVVVLLDSLNRHMLGSYGGTEFATPNLDRFAARSTQFTNHVTGSLPCMPARHDILVGALDFLWKPWGSIELWEESITATLRRADVTTMLVSDHPHLFETGGENYHTDFSAWDYLRGHEGDPWRTCPDPSAFGAPTITNAADGGWFLRDQLGIADRSFGRRHYDDSRTWFRAEEDFPGPRTMAAATSWLRDQSPSHDRWMLFVDEFDPHEPFDTPEPWASMYDDEPLSPEELATGRLVWPPYIVGGTTTGTITERPGPPDPQQLRRQAVDDRPLVRQAPRRTRPSGPVGHHRRHRVHRPRPLPRRRTHDRSAGPRHHSATVADIWGKPMVPQFEPLGHTPLMIHWPGSTSARTLRWALTTNVDINATIADVFGVEAKHRTHGRSLVPLLDGTATSIRDWAIGGVYGNWVQVTDGRRKYARAPVDDNFPLSMWSNRWSTMPVHKGLEDFMRFPTPDRRATLDFMPGSDIPVIRQPFANGDVLPFWASGGRNVGRHHLYDLDVDPDEHENRRGGAQEADMADLLRTTLIDVEAPGEQLERLGLA